MSQDEREGNHASQDPEKEFAEFLRRRHQGEPLEFESFCTERPEISDALRALYSARVRGETVGVPELGGDVLEPGGTPSFRLADPERVGPYKILEKIGEGGMGTVYLAEQQEPVRRRVALKVIKLGMDTRETIARFEAERQALAMMNHPAIARIYDAGATADGRPWFAMEYVQGMPITEYCDRHKLTLRERLELFVQVCLGIEHAHHRGVLHRDIKPTNILVTAPDTGAMAKIIDFGVAKATNQRLTEKTLYTEIGRAVGTPAYMSPEQAELTGEDVDHRSDVYSLGVVLYELLVAQLPLDLDVHAVAFDEIVRRIRDEEPVTPSARWSRLNVERTAQLAAQRRTNPSVLTTELRGDLDWVCMKAIAKERTRRYSTAAQFAEDISRYLRSEPVEARPPSMMYRLHKYVRKNRLPVCAALAVTLTLAAGLVTSSVLYWHMRHAWRETDVARIDESERAREAGEALAAKQAALQESERLRQQAEKNARVARANRLAAQSRALLEDKPQLALLLAAEAADTNLAQKELITPECHRALLDGLSRVSGRPLLRGENVVAVSPDVRSAVVLRGKGRTNVVVLVTALDAAAATWAPLFEIGLRIRPEAVFSRNGEWLFVGESSTLRVFRTAAPERPQLETTGRTWALSPGGEVLAVAHQGTVTAWRFVDSKAVQLDGVTAVLGKRPVELLGLSGTGGRLLVADLDFRGGLAVAACDVLETHISITSRRTLTTSGRSHVAFSPDGDRFAIADETAVRVERVESADSPLLLKVGPEWDGSSIVRFSSTGRSVAVGCRGGRVYWWSLDTASSTPVVLRADPFSISHLIFTADDSHLIAACGHSLHAWRLSAPIDTNGVRYAGHDSSDPIPGEPVIERITLGADPSSFISTTAGGARVWNLGQPSASPHVELVRRKSLVNVDGPHVALSERGDRAVAWYQSRNPEALDAPKLYDLNSDTLVDRMIELSAHPSGIWRAVFDARGEMLLVLDATRLGVVSLDTYDLRAQNVLSTRRTRFEFAASRPQTTMSPDGRWLAVMDTLSIWIWDMRKIAASDGIVPPLLLTFKEEQGTERGSLFDLLVFSARGSWLAAYSSKVENLAAWKFEDGRVEPHLEVELPKTTQLRFSSDEKFLAASDFEGRVHIWRVNGTVDPKAVTLPSIAPHEVGEDVMTSPDGRWLVATYRGLGGVGVADLRRIETQATLTRLAGAFGNVTFDPSGRRLITDSRQQYGRLLVWDTQDFSRDPTPVSVGTMDFTVGSLTFSRDGAWLVSSSSREVMVWPYEKSVSGYLFSFPDTIVRDAVVSGNGRWLIVSHRDGVDAWALDFEAFTTLARRQAGRDFTTRERERYLYR